MAVVGRSSPRSGTLSRLVPLTLYFSFFVTTVLLALTPGPDVLLVVATAGRQGFLSAFKLTLGFATGCLIHTLLLALGVTALILATPWAIKLVTLLGAGYLLYLACQTWLHRSDDIEKPQRVVEASYLRGVIMNVTNPKVLLFFFALFPQFAALEQPGAGMRLLWLGAIFSFVTVLVFGSLAWLTNKSLSHFFENPRFKWWMDRVSALIFFILALFLLSTLWVSG